MAVDPVVPSSRRRLFHNYIYFLLQRHHIPLPRKFHRDKYVNTDQELWGYFIERLFRRCVQKITFLPTNGYTVCDLNSKLLNKSFILTAKYVNVFNNNLFTRDFSITTKGTMSISGDNYSVVLSVELRNKFYTTQVPVGATGETHTYSLANVTSLMGNYGFNPADTLAVGSTVFASNRYQLEVVSVDTISGTYEARTITSSSSDIWYIINDIRNTLIAHLNDFNNPHHVTLSQADLYQVGDVVLHHNIYNNNNVSGSKYVTYNEVMSMVTGGTTSLSGKFHSSQNGAGAVGAINTYTTALAIPYVGGETLSVGATVFLANRYEVIVTSVNGATYTAQTVSTYSGDISYLLQSILTDIDNLKINIQNVADDLSDHIQDYNNPHRTTLSQADTAQTGDVILHHNLYNNTNVSNNKYITYGDAVSIATTIVSGGSLYMGQVKYGADNSTSMNLISSTGAYSLASGDQCIVQAIGVNSPFSLYEWNGASWVNVTPAYALGNYYDMTFWYGTWFDGLVYHGDVSAKTTCNDAALNEWDLIVYTDLIIDGSVITQKLADDAVTNAKMANMPAYTLKGNATATSANPQDLTVAQIKTLLGYIDTSDATTIINSIVSGSIGDRTINIQKNGVTAGSFTTNENGVTAKDINITVPTIEITSNVLKGDGMGNAISAIPGTDYADSTTITNLQNQINTINSTLSSIQTDITNIQNDISTINSTLTSISNSINNILTRLSTAETNITNIQNDISTINSSISTINTSITNIDGRVTTLETNYNTLSTTVNNIVNNYSGLVIKALSWNTSGVISVTTNLSPTVRTITKTDGTAIAGSPGFSGIGGSSPNFTFTFTPATATDITQNEFILIVY